MDTILRYMTGHPTLAWSIIGAAAVVALLVTLYILYLLFVLLVYVRGRFEKDRRGARLTIEALRFDHDEERDEIQLGWTIVNHGKFVARRLYASISLRVRCTDELVASWRQTRSDVALEPGARIDIVVRVTRLELNRLTQNFQEGTLNLWSHHSSTPPKKPANFFGTYGPSIRVNLGVGQVASQDCVTVIDPTPVPARQFS